MINKIHGMKVDNESRINFVTALRLFDKII
jgi:hypothetical protein